MADISTLTLDPETAATLKRIADNLDKIANAPRLSPDEQKRIFAHAFNAATRGFQDRNRRQTPAQAEPGSPTHPGPDPADPPHPA